MKYKCGLIRDLIPLCIDNAAAEESKNAVVEHLAECRECESFYNNMIKEIPLSSYKEEESKGYVAVAKKLRKRKIVIRALTAMLVFVVFELLINYAAGFRFSPESAAELSGKLNASSELIGHYDWGNRQFYFFDSENSYEVVTVNRFWNGWKTLDNYLVWPKYPTDKGSIINAGSMYYWTDTDKKGGIQLFPIIVEDSKVANVEVTVFGKTQKANTEKGKFTLLIFKNNDPNTSNVASGVAYDSNGNILYKLTKSKESLRLLWEKVTP